MVVHGEWPEGYVGVDGLEGDVQEVMKTEKGIRVEHSEEVDFRAD